MKSEDPKLTTAINDSTCSRLNRSKEPKDNVAQLSELIAKLEKFRFGIVHKNLTRYRLGEPSDT